MWTETQRYTTPQGDTKVVWEDTCGHAVTVPAGYEVLGDQSPAGYVRCTMCGHTDYLHPLDCPVGWGGLVARYPLHADRVQGWRDAERRGWISEEGAR
jgi:hypothetical protein